MKKKGLLALILAAALVGTMVPGAAATVSAAESTFLDQYEKIENISDDTYMGADFSYYQADLDWGKTYFNYKQEEVNPFEFVKSQGINTISVRASVDASKATDEAKYFSLDNAVATLKEAKKAGLDTNLVLLYSENMTWASTQTVPEGWSDEIEGTNGNDQTEVVVHAKAYTQDTLDYLKTQDAVPTMITIGNEVDYNFLNYSGDNQWIGWKAMGDISWIIRNFDENIKIGTSFAAPNDDGSGIQWILGKLNDSWNNVQYDYVGVNLYEGEGLCEKAETMKNTFVDTENSAGKTAQFYISGIEFTRKSASDSSISEETQSNNIYNLLSATISEKNAGGLNYTNAEFVGSWKGFFDNENDNSKGVAVISLATFAYAKGDKVDVSTEYEVEDNPYKYGTDFGLKDQEVKIETIPGMGADMIRGVDISTYTALKEAGVKFYNDNGEEESLLKVLSDHGINYVRIRIWNNPYNSEGKTYGGGSNDVEHGLTIAKEAAKYNMKVLLCFMYSDFWADPTQQHLPKAWKADAENPEKMCDNIYTFTKDTVNRFNEVAEVGMVQVGNEITNGFCGILWDKKSDRAEFWGGKNTGKKLTSYLNAGAKAVRETAPKALIALQLETPNVDKYKTIMECWEKYQVDYDVLGSSYYPFWKQKIATLDSVQDMVEKKGKLFVVLETSWMTTQEDADGTTNQLGENVDLSVYNVGVQGQVDVLSDLYTSLAAHQGSLGAFYWEPAWIPVKAGWVNWEYNKQMSEEYGTGWATSAAVEYLDHSKLYYKDANGVEKESWGGSSWDNQSLFDFNGHPLKSLDFYKDAIDTTAEGRKIYSLTLSTTDYTYNGETKQPSITIKRGNTVIASKLRVSTEEYEITYPEVSKKIGTYEVKVTFTVDGALQTLTATYNINPPATKIVATKAGKNAILVKWSKKKSKVKGYILQVSTSKTFKKSATKSYKIKSYKTVSKKVTKLKRHKKYYLRVATYYGKNQSKWSKVKAIKTK